MFSKLNTEEKRDISSKITDIFRLRYDLKKLYNFMDRDEILCEIKNKLYGLKQPGIGMSIFEGAIRVIIQLCVPDDLGARKAVSYFYFE